MTRERERFDLMVEGPPRLWKPVEEDDRIARARAPASRVAGGGEVPGDARGLDEPVGRGHLADRFLLAVAVARAGRGCRGGKTRRRVADDRAVLGKERAVVAAVRGGSVEPRVGVDRAQDQPAHGENEER